MHLLSKLFYVHVKQAVLHLLSISTGPKQLEGGNIFYAKEYD